MRNNIDHGILESRNSIMYKVWLPTQTLFPQSLHLQTFWQHLSAVGLIETVLGFFCALLVSCPVERVNKWWLSSV